MATFIQGLPRPPLLEATNFFTAAWAGWFSTAQTILMDVSQSGTTAQRPTTSLYVGKTYFDTTLGLPIWLKSAGTSPVWVNATGSAV